MVEMSVKRWVTLFDTKEDIVATTWHESMLITTKPTRNDFRETIDTLLTSLSADFIRAQGL